MLNKSLFTSNSEQWETPPDLFKKLDDEFHFTLDPCADNCNHKCEKYFTKEQNGLIKDWSNNVVFCNPPYGKKIGEWVEKSFNSAYKQNCTVVMLLPARTDTRWFHKWIYHKAEIRFICGRLKFGGSKNSAPFPSMVVVFRK